MSDPGYHPDYMTSIFRKNFGSDVEQTLRFDFSGRQKQLAGLLQSIDQDTNQLIQTKDALTAIETCLRISEGIAGEALDGLAKSSAKGEKISLDALAAEEQKMLTELNKIDSLSADLPALRGENIKIFFSDQDEDALEIQGDDVSKAGLALNDLNFKNVNNLIAASDLLRSGIETVRGLYVAVEEALDDVLARKSFIEGAAGLLPDTQAALGRLGDGNEVAALTSKQNMPVFLHDSDDIMKETEQDLIKLF